VTLSLRTRKTEATLTIPRRKTLSKLTLSRKLDHAQRRSRPSPSSRISATCRKGFRGDVRQASI